MKGDGMMSQHSKIFKATKSVQWAYWNLLYLFPLNFKANIKF